MKSVAFALLMLWCLPARQDADIDALFARAKIGPKEAVEKALKEAKEGVVTELELELDKGKAVWSIDIAQGTMTFAIALDAENGAILEQETENEDRSQDQKGMALGVLDALKRAESESKGRAFHAMRKSAGGRSGWSVEVSVEKKRSTVRIDDSGAGAATATATEPTFTDAFGEEAADLGPTGKNPYFILEPGYTMILEGVEGQKPVRIVVTVLAETKSIDGVECRVVTEEESVDGKRKELTRDYFAISKRTNNVYYFGEDVDVFEKDGSITHEGSWLSGKNGARYGLAMPAVPLAGARYQQETAPGIAMDRGEIVAGDERFECPAGKFEKVLVIEETTPLEKGKERKRYARGVGILEDGDTRLVRYGMNLK